MPKEKKPSAKSKGYGKNGTLKNSSYPGASTTKKRGNGNTSLPGHAPAPPMTSYGGTIIASNPFDDRVPTNSTMIAPPMTVPSVSHMTGSPMCLRTGAVSTGKIYPSDQSMVFNSQNPNAPPIYPCGVCHKEVSDNDQAILCESGCNFWFHRICTGLTDTAYHLLTMEVFAEWVCDNCLSCKDVPLVKFKP